MRLAGLTSIHVALSSSSSSLSSSLFAARVLTSISTLATRRRGVRRSTVVTAQAVGMATSSEAPPVAPAEQPHIELNADKTVRAVVHTDDLPWTPSPSAGVFRRMIERKGGEVARATTIVRFDPNRHFSRHTHAGGEEFYVLDGVWRDDYGVFPRGSYVRNYIGSGHTPSIGAEGCTILVKLRQMDPQLPEPETRAWRADPDAEGWESLPDGRRVLALHESANEKVRVEQWPAGLSADVTLPPDGEELLVLEGELSDPDLATQRDEEKGAEVDDGTYRRRTWARNPASLAGRVVRRTAGPEGCLVWFKTNHLNSPEIGV